MGYQYRKTSRNYQFGDTTFRGYFGHFRTLNGERLLFNPLRGLTVVRRNAVLNGILQRPPLNATALMVPKLIVPLLLMQVSDTDTPKSSQREFGADLHFTLAGEVVGEEGGGIVQGSAEQAVDGGAGTGHCGVIGP